MQLTKSISKTLLFSLLLTFSAHTQAAFNIRDYFSSPFARISGMINWYKELSWPWKIGVGVGALIGVAAIVGPAYYFLYSRNQKTAVSPFATDPCAPKDILEAAGRLNLKAMNTFLEHSNDAISSLFFGAKSFNSTQVLMTFMKALDTDFNRTRPVLCNDEKPQAIALISRLIKEHIEDVNFCDTAGMAPLVYASKWGELELVKLLIACGADHRYWHKNEMHVLHYAAENGHLEVVKYFVNKCSIDPNITKFGLDLTPLQYTQNKYNELRAHGSLPDSIKQRYEETIAYLKREIKKSEAKKQQRRLASNTHASADAQAAIQAPNSLAQPVVKSSFEIIVTPPLNNRSLDGANT